MKNRCRTGAALFILMLLFTGHAQPAVTADVTALQGVVDLDGKATDPFATATDLKARVFLFLAVECPISNKYIPELKRLLAKFEPLGVRFWFVYPDPDSTPEIIARHLETFDFKGRVLRDPRQKLASKSHAEFTPEAAVFSPAGELLYHGRIDDRFPALGIDRTRAAERTLHEVLTSFLAGQTFPVKEATPVGCRIPAPR